MDTEIIIIYCVCDDYLHSIHHQEDLQCLMSDGEVMTTTLVAALYFGGNFAMAQRFLNRPEYVASMLSRSRFSRRLHRIKHHFLAVFGLLAEMWKQLNDSHIYTALILFLWPSAITSASQGPRFIKKRPFIALRPAKGAISMG